MLSCAETDGSFETPQRNRALGESPFLPRHLLETFTKPPPLSNRPPLRSHVLTAHRDLA